MQLKKKNTAPKIWKVILELREWNLRKELLPNESLEEGLALGTQRVTACKSDYLDVWHVVFMIVISILASGKAVFECPRNRAVMNLGKPP